MRAEPATTRPIAEQSRAEPVAEGARLDLARRQGQLRDRVGALAASRRRRSLGDHAGVVGGASQAVAKQGEVAVVLRRGQRLEAGVHHVDHAEIAAGPLGPRGAGLHGAPFQGEAAVAVDGGPVGGGGGGLPGLAG